MSQLREKESLIHFIEKCAFDNFLFLQLLFIEICFWQFAYQSQLNLREKLKGFENGELYDPRKFFPPEISISIYVARVVQMSVKQWSIKDFQA